MFHLRSAFRSGCAALLFCMFLPPVLSAQHSMNTRIIIDFSNTASWEPWMPVNDVVMGGVSSSEISATDSGTAVFRGTVSLENNGGFASVRSGPAEFDMEGYDGIRLRVRGDGSDYRLRLRTTDSFDGVAYQQTFGTTAGEWITVDIPFADFTASFRGRRVPDAPALNPANIRQIGFLIADRQTGPFALEIAEIRAYVGSD